MNFKIIFLAAATIAMLSGCTMGKERAERAVAASGMTDIQLGGHAWFACGKGDGLSRTFTAKNAKGGVVTGAVCGNWFKGATVRID